ncbi:conserved hypothetical protein [Syntrophobacter sp. SbD1]|nr:conserved hypothetical protein [Syntrophobacter sp. SbD1]
MPKFKFTDIELRELVKKGLTCAAMAKHLGVTRSAVSMRLARLRIAVSKDVTIRSAREIVDREINALDQLQKINRDANEILDLLMRWNRGDGEALQVLESQARRVRSGKGENAGELTEYKLRDPRELALKAMQEIRGQLKLQLEVFQALFDMQAVRQFQTEVLEAIESVSPETREEIIRRLTERNALRSALDLN